MKEYYKLMVYGQTAYNEAVGNIEMTHNINKNVAKNP
jgi:hypothetical protein